MKKQTNPDIKAHLLRSAFYVLLLVAVCIIPFALAQRAARARNRFGTERHVPHAMDVCRRHASWI